MTKARAIILLIVGFGVLLIVATRFSQWMDRIDNAWAYANPPLVGDWQGEAVAGDTRLRLAISLVRDKFDWINQGDSVDNHRSLSGRAMICDSTGRVQAYPIAGLVEDKRGRNTMLTLSPPPNEVPGLRLTRVTLNWDGGRELRAHAQLAHALPAGGTRTSSSDPLTGHEIAFILRAGGGQTCTAP